jgi:hypothetical protein
LQKTIEFVSRLLDFGAIEEILRAEDQNGTFDVIISTEVTDRAGKSARQNSCMRLKALVTTWINV